MEDRSHQEKIRYGSLGFKERHTHEIFTFFCEFWTCEAAVENKKEKKHRIFSHLWVQESRLAWSIRNSRDTCLMLFMLEASWSWNCTDNLAAPFKCQSHIFNYILHLHLCICLNVLHHIHTQKLLSPSSTERFGVVVCNNVLRVIFVFLELWP